MVHVPMVRRSRSVWPEMRTLSREMDNLFSGLNFPGLTQDLWSPAVDVEEMADELVFRAELPGMTADDIDIELEDGVLTIQGEKKEHRKDENATGLLYERRWGTFTRRFTLPRAVEADQVTADYDKGVLTIRVPKAEEAKGRKIRITNGAPRGRDVSES